MSVVLGPGRRLLALAALLSLLTLPAGQVGADPWWKRGTDLVKGLAGSSGGLSVDEIAEGLKEALRIGSQAVVAQLARPGGFEGDPAVRIPLPDALTRMRTALDRIGLAGSLDDLERKLNEAAELATPKAGALFLQAISDMTLDDAREILGGPADAATRYFESRMSTPLAREMEPIVRASLGEVGAIRSYDELIVRYHALPFVPTVEADLTPYVVGGAMDGIFHYLAQQEAAIRSDPAARTTELLQKVFGSR